MDLNEMWEKLRAGKDVPGHRYMQIGKFREKIRGVFRDVLVNQTVIFVGSYGEKDAVLISVPMYEEFLRLKQIEKDRLEQE